MSAPLPEAIARAAEALIQALSLPCCIQVTINLSDDGRIQSIEPRLKLVRRTNGRDKPPPVA